MVRLEIFQTIAVWHKQGMALREMARRMDQKARMAVRQDLRLAAVQRRIGSNLECRGVRFVQLRRVVDGWRHQRFHAVVSRRVRAGRQRDEAKRRAHVLGNGASQVSL